MKSLGTAAKTYKGRQETCGSPFKSVPKVGRSDDEWMRNMRNDYSKDGMPEPEMPGGYPALGRVIRVL